MKRKESKKMFDAFIEFIDGLFWDGYAQQLATENPKQYNYELNEFFNNYAQ